MTRRFHAMCTYSCSEAVFIFITFVPFMSFCQDHMLPHPVGLYPLNDLYRTADASCYGNLGGTPEDVKLVKGPFGKESTAYQFAGIGTSYINIPGSRHLDTQNSITILVWIFQTGHAGSIIAYFNSNRHGQGDVTRTASVEILTSSTSSVSSNLRGRNGKSVRLSSNNSVTLDKEWHYVGVSYNHIGGTAILWIDGNAVQQLILGDFKLSTDGDIRIGGRQGKGDSFEGRISCVQIYDKAFSRKEVEEVKNRCLIDDHAPINCGKSAAPSGCGLFLQALSGTFSSPGYPSGYPYNANCVWEITVPKGYFITLKFEKFDLEEFNCLDYIIIRDGTSSWSSRLASLCGGGADSEMELRSSGNGMRVEFVSDRHNSAPGFLVTYTSSLIDVKVEKGDDMLDFSRHYTGIVIGVACAAIFAILSVITFSHTRRRFRERRHDRSLTRTNRHSVSFTENDVVQQNAPPTYDDVMRFPELYPPTPLQGSLATTPAGTPRVGSPISTPPIPRRLSNRPGSPALVPKMGTPIGMPLLNLRRSGPSSPHSTSRVSLQRGISPLARAELTPQHSRQADHASSDEHDNEEVDDDELPPYPGLTNVDSVLDQVRETLQHRRFAPRQASNPSLSDSNSVNSNQTRTESARRGSQTSVSGRDNSGRIETRLSPNRNSLRSDSVQSFENNTGQGDANPWVSLKTPKIAAPVAMQRSMESVV